MNKKQLKKMGMEETYDFGMIDESIQKKIKAKNKVEQNVSTNQNVNQNPIQINLDDKKNDKYLITKEIIPRGLNNIGATCYMNSVLQCLYHVQDLSNEILFLASQILKNKKKLPMTLAFLQVVYELSFSRYKSMSPVEFKKIIGNDETFRYFEANDSKTLALYVLDNLNRELSENKIKSENNNIVNQLRNYQEKDAQDIVKSFNEQYNSIVGDLFNGLKKTNYICSTCQNCVKNYQIFNFIQCSIEKTFIDKYNKNKAQKDLKLHVLDCLKFEEKPVIFSGDNQIYCEQCKKTCDARSENKMCIAPKILIIFLNRGVDNKFMCEVDFPEMLDINDYLEVKDKNYHLIGVIEHLGPSGQSGHFIANCKHFDGNWYMFSDSSIYTTKNQYKKYGIPYLLFYRRED